MFRRSILFTVTLMAGAAVWFWSTFWSSPLVSSSPFIDQPPLTQLPPAHPPPEMALYRLSTGVTHRSAAFAYRGGSFFDWRDFSIAAALIHHPRGDLLIDSGLSKHIESQFAKLPTWFQLSTRYTPARTAADQLDEVGYDQSQLAAILLTHAHWDHISGVIDFPETPVWIAPQEHQFVANGGWITINARAVSAKRYKEYRFDAKPYLGFEASWDVYSDGAVVVVPAPGHTPGSVIVFVTLPTQQRYAFVGDLVWQREGIFEREERPWLQRTLADSDPDSVRTSIQHMSALVTKFPELHIIPAHDARAFSELPVLSGD